MIVGLFLLVVGLVLALLAIVVVHARFVRATTASFLAHLRIVELEGRAERALLLRAALARNGAEFGQLDKIRQQETAQRPASTVSMTPEQYAQWLVDDLQAGLGGVADSDVPLVPEGFG